MASSGLKGAECTPFWRLGAFVGSFSEAITDRLPMNDIGTWVRFFCKGTRHHTCILSNLSCHIFVFAGADNTHCASVFEPKV